MHSTLKKVQDRFTQCQQLSEDYKRKHNELLQLYHVLSKYVLLYQRKISDNGILSQLESLMKQHDGISPYDMEKYRKIQAEIMEEVEFLNETVDKDFFTEENEFFNQLTPEEKERLRHDKKQQMQLFKTNPYFIAYRTKMEKEREALEYILPFMRSYYEQDIGSVNSVRDFLKKTYTTQDLFQIQIVKQMLDLLHIPEEDMNQLRYHGWQYVNPYTTESGSLESMDSMETMVYDSMRVTISVDLDKFHMFTYLFIHNMFPLYNDIRKEWEYCHDMLKDAANEGMERNVLSIMIKSYESGAYLEMSDLIIAQCIRWRLPLNIDWYDFEKKPVTLKKILHEYTSCSDLEAIYTQPPTENDPIIIQRLYVHLTNNQLLLSIYQFYMTYRYLPTNIWECMTSTAIQHLSGSIPTDACMDALSMDQYKQRGNNRNNVGRESGWKIPWYFWCFWYTNKHVILLKDIRSLLYSNEGLLETIRECIETKLDGEPNPFLLAFVSKMYFFVQRHLSQCTLPSHENCFTIYTQKITNIIKVYTDCESWSHQIETIH